MYTPLYCENCNAYLAGLSDTCHYCKHEHHDSEDLENECAVLYCGDCSNYLGSSGGKFCSCGWNVLKDKKY